MPRMDAPDATYPTMKHWFKWARVLDLDPAWDTARIEIIDKDGNGTGEVWENVPIFYHCEPNAKQRPNGALEGASEAFEVGDEVIVKFEDEKPIVVARRAGVRACRAPFYCKYDMKWYGIFLKENHIIAIRKTNKNILNISLPNLPPDVYTTSDRIKYDILSAYNRFGKKIYIYKKNSFYSYYEYEHESWAVFIESIGERILYEDYVFAFVWPIYLWTRGYIREANDKLVIYTYQRRYAMNDSNPYNSWCKWIKETFVFSYEEKKYIKIGEEYELVYGDTCATHTPPWWDAPENNR